MKLLKDFIMLNDIVNAEIHDKKDDVLHFVEVNTCRNLSIFDVYEQFTNDFSDNLKETTKHFNNVDDLYKFLDNIQLTNYHLIIH